MFNLMILTALSFSNFIVAAPQAPLPNTTGPNVPDGYQVGMATVRQLLTVQISFYKHLD